MKFCILFRGAKWKINRPQALKHPQTLPIIVCAKNCWSISISSPADWEQHPVTAASTWNVCFLLLFMINLKVCWGFFQSDQSTNLPFFFFFFTSHVLEIKHATADTRSKSLYKQFYHQVWLHDILHIGRIYTQLQSTGVFLKTEFSQKSGLWRRSLPVVWDVMHDPSGRGQESHSEHTYGKERLLQESPWEHKQKCSIDRCSLE